LRGSALFRPVGHVSCDVFVENMLITPLFLEVYEVARLVKPQEHITPLHISAYGFRLSAGF